MARALIVGCGCRGTALGARLAAEEWEVRGTTRREDGRARIEEAGIEPASADPERPGTVLDLVGDVAVVVWLLGAARGEPDEVAAIHGARLEGLLARLVDTPVRGFAYEPPAGGGPDGTGIVERASATWSIPFTVLPEPAGGWWDEWAAGAADRVAALLA